MHDIIGLTHSRATYDRIDILRIGYDRIEKIMLLYFSTYVVQCRDLHIMQLTL